MKETEKQKTKNRKRWEEKYIHVMLNNEIYPNAKIRDTYFKLTKEEIKELEKKTNRRIKYYNKRCNPKGHAGYSDYGK